MGCVGGSNWGARERGVQGAGLWVVHGGRGYGGGGVEQGGWYMWEWTRGEVWYSGRYSRKVQEWIVVSRMVQVGSARVHVSIADRGAAG